MRDRRVHGTAGSRARSSSPGCSAWSIAATTRPASPSSMTRATCSSRRRPASSPTSRRPSPTGRRTPRSASPTPAGPPTAARTTSTPIPTRTARATSRSSTTGSSRTSGELRDGLEARGHRLTSETDTEALAHLIEEAYDGDLADAVRAALRAGRGRVRHRGHAPRRGRPARRRPPGRAARRRAGGRRELPRERRRGDPRPHRPGHLPRGGRRRRPAPRRASTITGVDGDPRERPVTDHRLVARGRREGRLRALHAQGDPRAARGARPVASPAGSAATDRILAGELDGLEPSAPRRSPGSSSWPAAAPRTRRLAGAAAIRGLDRPAGPGHGRLGVPLRARRRSTSTPSSSP